MANPQITEYIRKQIKAGYNVTTIRDYLIKYGYNASDVDVSINELYPLAVSHHVHHISKNSIIAIASISLLLVILIPTIYILMSGTTQPSQLLDLKTSVLKENINQGNKVEFNIELSNLGRAKRYDVFLRHEIVGTDIYIEETIAVETSTSKTSSIQLPTKIAAKRHNLKTIASYGGKKAFSTFGFNVIDIEEKEVTCTENWECTQWIPNKCPQSQKQTRACNDLNNCGTTFYKPETSQSCIYEPEQIDTQIPLPQGTIWEKLDIIKEQAKTNPSAAKKECLKIDIESHKDECYYNVAESTLQIEDCNLIISDRTKDKCINNLAKTNLDSSMCQLIEKESRRDSCYMNFVNNKDYTVCDKIANPYLKEACEALRDMPEIVSP